MENEGLSVNNARLRRLFTVSRKAPKGLGDSPAKRPQDLSREPFQLPIFE